MNRDEFFGILHELAEKTRQELESSFTESNVLAIRQLVKEFLVDCELPNEFTASSFADIVTTLRENERAWSRKLGEIIIIVEDKMRVGDKTEAIDTLGRYVDQCPWLSLREIAKIEQENFRRD
ncbi:MAG: hypothetical protein SFU55_04810 [Methylophilus sp.]|nr:hypothetical protein [Methylophilus sp.]